MAKLLMNFRYAVGTRAERSRALGSAIAEARIIAAWKWGAQAAVVAGWAQSHAWSTDPRTAPLRAAHQLA